MNVHLFVQQRLVKVFNVAGANVNLPVVFAGIQELVHEEMDLHLIFFNHKIIGIIRTVGQLEAQLVYLTR